MTWDPKDPNETERFAIDWLPRLAAGEVVTGVWTDTPSPLFDLVTTAGLVKGAETFDDRYSYVTLSGGTDGGTAVITARVRTSDGNEIEETRELFIRSTASAVALVDYEVPGAAYFVERYPRFANASGAAVQDALDEAAEQVDETWLARDFPRAVMLYAAHLLTLRGQGSGAESKLHGDGLSGFQSIRSGALSLDRGTPGPTDPIKSTSYGQQFAELRRKNFAGPRVLDLRRLRPCSPLANDCDF
jgi:hypothetical protein